MVSVPWLGTQRLYPWPDDGRAVVRAAGYERPRPGSYPDIHSPVFYKILNWEDGNLDEDKNLSYTSGTYYDLSTLFILIEQNGSYVIR